MSSRQDLANAIRALAMDAVQQANSGHPGAPMGMADIAEVLWNDFMVHNPANPDWPNRDRFLLSNGHASMLLYALLHLTGYDLPMEQLKNFRQLHSMTPGHPEYGYAPGIETTTGPLGQGLANGVGMALAEKALAAQFNQPSHEIIDHYTYVFLGDGCLMEGISHEACSLAGTLGLGKLIVFYDDNNISIDGEVRGSEDTPGWFCDDTPKRFEAYGWHVVRQVNGHDPDAISAAVEMARDTTDRPTLICCQTIIGYGAPNKQGKESCHGAPLGEDEVAATRENLGWDAPPFKIPDSIYSGWNAKERGAKAEADWNERLSAYAKSHPDLAAELKRRLAGELPDNWDEQAAAFIDKVAANPEKIASRKASQNTLNAFGPLLPELLGGSADLAGSNLTLWQDAKGIGKGEQAGNYVYYGVREFAMSAMMNGIALHGGFIPYGGTFLMFSEYARNALRMASLMKSQAIFVYTHDSIGLGEDGPTHQPIEQLPTLRMIPGMSVWRPCDAVESAVAWKVAIERFDGPTCLIFSRQGLAPMQRDDQQRANIVRGGYILRDCEGTPDVILIATGSEVELAVQAAEALSDKAIRVVSMPSTDTFDAQDADYREQVLPNAVTARVAVEAAVPDGWWKYVGSQGAVLGIERFGESAPASDLFKEFGFTVDNLVSKIQSIL